MTAAVPAPQSRGAIFGREPTLVVGAIQSVLAVAISFGWLSGIGLSTQDDLAVVMAVVIGVSAVYLAWATSETLLAPLVGLLKAFLALGAIYGLHISTEQTGELVAVITAVFAMWQRTQVVPLARPTFRTGLTPDDGPRHVRGELGVVNSYLGLGVVLIVAGLLVWFLTTVPVLGVILFVVGVILLVVALVQGRNTTSL